MNEFKDIDNLSPSDFEIFVKDLFCKAGWTDARVTKLGEDFTHGDGGVDIFAYKNKRKFAIEVKQRNINNLVDVSALNQLVTGAKLSNANNMILVTNSYFTSEVKVRALRLGVELIDRDELHNLFIEEHSEIGRGIKPRKYQQAVIEECLTLFNRGKRKVLIEMATGLGKTYTIACLVKSLFQNSNDKIRVLFLAHQVEILLQSVTSFKNVFGVGTYSFSACFNGVDPEETDFVFATFDTLYSKLHKLSSTMFDIVVVDEAHHTPAKTYANVVQFFNPRYLLGLTATPERMDNQDVLDFFGGHEGHIGKLDLVWALKHNKLAFPKYMVMLDDLEQSKIDQLKQGLTLNDVDKQLFLHKKDEELIKILEEQIIEKKILNPKAIVFCRNIKHIKHLISFFQPSQATFVHSKMKSEQRRQNIRDFREGDYKFILVCDLFNEGIDIPETNILVFLRYTGSRTIWLQQLGRGLRKTSNKDHVNVYDFVGSFERLKDIRALQKSVQKQKINVDFLSDDDEVLDTVQKENKIVHDSSIEVNYNQSAAQVIALIEDFEYRLKTKKQIIINFRNNNKAVPILEDLEEALIGTSIDQINTLFDSYFDFLCQAFGTDFNRSYFRDKYVLFINDFYGKYHILPSYKAISNSLKYKGLLAANEVEVKTIIGDDLRSLCFKINTNEMKKSEDHINVKEDFVLKQKELLEKYQKRLTTFDDIKKLSKEEREEIKTIFKSEFKFVSLVKDYSSKNL